MLQKMSPGPGIDLDQLGDETLELAGYAGRAIEYDPASRQVIEAAAEFALLQGYAEIRSPHLFAALITDGSWLAGALGRDHIRPEQLLRNILALVPPQSLPPGLAARVYPGLTVQKILLDAVRNAQSEGRRTISEADVGKALLADDAGIVVQTLRRMRLDWLAQEPYKE
jgi:ATP-dependent Clp protease ATP-binding subunit ClpA